MNSGTPNFENFVELRVHGVSGTTPESLLNCPDVVQLAGDRTSGFYRPRQIADRLDVALVGGLKPRGSGPNLEAYSWGGLTSGAPSRALWLLLLPFTLANVAPRMRPSVKSSCATELLIGAMWFFARLLAVTMTTLIVVSACGVGMDIFAWQCGRTSDQSCKMASPGWLLRPLLGLSQDLRLVVGAIVPLVLLVLLWKVSGRTINSYEAVSRARDGKVIAPPETSEKKNAAEPGLASPWMWHNEFQVRRLRQLHLQAGFAVVLWLASCSLPGGWQAARWVLMGTAAYVVAMLIVPAYTGRDEGRGFFRSNIAMWLFLTGYAIALAIELIWENPGVVTKGSASLPDFDGTALTILATVVGCLAIFSSIIVILALVGPTERLRPHALGGCTAVVVATLSVFLAAVFSAGVYVFSIGWLTTGSLKPGFATLTRKIEMFDIPAPIAAACRSYPFCVAGLLLVAIAFGLISWIGRSRRLPKVFRSDLEADYGDELRVLSVLPASSDEVDAIVTTARETVEADATASGMDDTEIAAAIDEAEADVRAYFAAVAHSRRAAILETGERARSISNTYWAARRVDTAQNYLVVLCGIGAIISGIFTWLFIVAPAARSRPDNTFLIRWYSFAPQRQGACKPGNGLDHLMSCNYLSAQSLEGTGAYLIVMTLVALVALGAAAFKVLATRKQVGILWDLASFWPRSAHPFAAACYAERSVPDLVTRLSAHADDQKRIVLAAHSQGTVISAATLFQLKKIDETDGSDVKVVPAIGFLSFGCVLRRLYARYFPAYFSERVLDELRNEVLTSDPHQVRNPSSRPRWRNLWRYSDYVGGKVMSGPPQHEESVTPNEIDQRDVDPLWARQPGDTRWPAAHMHSDYWLSPNFQAQVHHLARMLADEAESPPETTTPPNASGC